MATTFEEAVIETAHRLHVALSDGEGNVPPTTLEGSQIVWEHVFGLLRGSIPYPVPDDLMGVAVSAGLRISKGFAQTGQLFIRQGEYNEIADLRPWLGFLLVERMILDRYRKTCA
jgi:hypothetical protein